ncbi:MAG: ADP-glyceromanno-heptose 6-epimerase [Bacteroidota bacterium]
MIIITGAAGFIGSNLIQKLNDEKFYDIVLVDDFSKKAKEINYITKRYTVLVDRKDFFEWLSKNHQFVQFIFHLGARTDTTEFDMNILNALNLNYSKSVWNACCQYGIPLIYASSAATYGDGALGYSDSHEMINKLSPLNPYGVSKNNFDVWALEQKVKPFFWTGIKFFNVYGPNEYHKGRMASVVYHAFNQVKTKKRIDLFKSHIPEFKNGEQMRDFIYIDDVVDVLYYFMHHRKNSGIYNLGTGKARTFNDLAKSVFKSLQLSENIGYIDTPVDIREKYQYFTEAKMEKFRSTGYLKDFVSLEDGISTYINTYLSANKIK